MIQIRMHQHNRQHDERYNYRIAAQTIACDQVLPIVQAFACGPAEKPVPVVRPLDIPDTKREVVTFQQAGWISGAWRHVTASNRGTAYHIRIPAIGTFDILNKGQFICCRDVLESDCPQWTEALFGPTVTLALALHEVWSLHASAASFQGRTIAFLGESGMGKSTLARYLDSQPRWRRLADDTLPVTLYSDALLALPHFPQFKLSPNEQPGIAMAAKMPVHALFVLAAPPHDSRRHTTCGVQIHPLTDQIAMLKLIRHTVAVRLFGRKLLAEHLTFAQIVAGTIPIYSLTYPREFVCLPAVRRDIESTLEGHEVERPLRRARFALPPRARTRQYT